MSRFTRFDVPRLVAQGAFLLLDREQGVLSLLTDGTITEQHLLSPSELYVVEALLSNYPEYCPYEAVLSAMTGKSIEQCRERVLWGLDEGEVDAVMRPVRNLLGRCRMKLRPFGIQVRSMIHTGYVLVPTRERVRERVR